MDEYVYEKYLSAGKIAAKARDIGVNLIRPGVKFIEVAEKLESKILDSGADLSFPVNIAINELAAHYSPRNDDELVFKRGDIVKLDVGSHIDGYIADTAITIELETNRYYNMIKASSDALENAINLMRANIDLSEIGKVIEETIKSYGYNSIDNLTGHSLDRFELHSGMSVPSVSNTICRVKPKPGDVLAIEPFATNGFGHVISGKGSNIYILKPTIKSKIIRDNKLKILLNRMRAKFKTLPFAQRWCNNMSDNIDISLRKLTYLGLIKNYPQLIEQNGGIVTQKEHTVIVMEDGCEVITAT